MKSLREIENDFVQNLRLKYINPSSSNPQENVKYFQDFLSTTGIDKLSANKLTDISTANEQVTNYLITKKSDVHEQQNIDDKYLESYNAAFFIKFLNKDILGNIKTDEKIFQSYNNLKNQQNTTFGSLIKSIEENLADKDRTLITYTVLIDSLKEKMLDEYFMFTNRDAPIENKKLFQNLVDLLGIDQIKDVKIKDRIVSIPGSSSILDSKVLPLYTFDVDQSGLSFLYFLALYKIISTATMINKGRSSFRLPSEIQKSQADRIKGNLAQTDLTVQNVLDIWNQGYDMYIDNKRFKLSDLSKIIAIGSIAGYTYYMLRKITK